MRQKREYRVLMMVVAFVLIASNSSLWAQDIGVTDSSIKIGMFSNTTGPGSIWGVSLPHGAITVYNEVNKAGGIHGRKIEPILIDDRGIPEGAKSAVKKLVYDDKVFILHGGVNSLAMYAAREDVINAKIPIVVLGGAMDKITEPVNRYIFSTFVPASADGLIYVDFLMSKPGTKRLAEVAFDNEWAKSKMEKALPLLKDKYGLGLVAKESMDFGATDATAQVLRIKQANPDAVIVNLYAAEAAVFCRDAYKYGLRVPFAAAITMVDMYDLRDRIGKGDEPVMNVFSVSFLKDTVQKFEDLLKIHATYFPQDKPSSWVLEGMGSARTVVEGLKRAGKNLTRERFMEALETLKEFDTGILSSRVTFTKDDHMGCKKGRMVTLVGGKEYYMDPKWVEGLKKWN